MKTKTYKVKIHKDEYKKINCLTCKFSDVNNNGKPCREGDFNRWTNCNNYQYWKPAIEKVLLLRLKKVWFDKIKSGEKTKEYRLAKEYYDTRFEGIKKFQYTKVDLQHGYSGEILRFKVKRIYKSNEKNDLNAPCVWVIELGDRIQGE